MAAWTNISSLHPWVPLIWIRYISKIRSKVKAVSCLMLLSCSLSQYMSISQKYGLSEVTMTWPILWVPCGTNIGGWLCVVFPHFLRESWEKMIDKEFLNPRRNGLIFYPNVCFLLNKRAANQFPLISHDPFSSIAIWGPRSELRKPPKSPNN